MTRRYPFHHLADCLPITRRSAYQAARRGTIHYLSNKDPTGRTTRRLWVDLEEFEVHYRHRPALLRSISDRVQKLDEEAAQG